MILNNTGDFCTNCLNSDKNFKRDYLKIKLGCNLTNKLNSIVSKHVQRNVFFNKKELNITQDSHKTLQLAANVLAVSYLSSSTIVKVKISDDFNFVVCHNALGTKMALPYLSQISFTRLFLHTSSIAYMISKLSSDILQYFN